MRKVETSTGAPLALVARVESLHLGLRHLELQQMRGAKSYQTIPGHRYELRCGEHPAAHDERPDDSAEEIAAELFAAAQAHHASAKGDERFRVLLYVIKKDGALDCKDAKFSLGDGEDIDHDAPAVIEAMARRDMLAEIRDYVKQLHVHDGEQQRSLREQLGEITKLVGTLATGINSIFGTLADTIPKLVNLRLEAVEDRAEAMLEGAGLGRKSSESSQWKESLSSLKELLRGPIGQAGLAKALGMSPEEAASLLGFNADPSKPGAANESPSVDPRVHLRELGGSLTDTQRTELRKRLGPTFEQAIMRAAMAPTVEAAVGPIVEAFDSLDQESFATFEEVLSERQLALVRLVFDSLDRLASEQD